MINRDWLPKDGDGLPKDLARLGLGLLAGFVAAGVCVWASMRVSGRKMDGDGDRDEALSYDEAVRREMADMAEASDRTIAEDLKMGGRPSLTAALRLYDLVEDLKSVPEDGMDAGTRELLSGFDSAAGSRDGLTSFFDEHHGDVVRAWFGVVAGMDEEDRTKAVSTGRFPLGGD